MRRYAMQGTPTLILLDRDGRLRRQSFGHIPDLQLGAEIMALMRDGVSASEQEARAVGMEPASAAGGACGTQTCTR